MSTRTIKPNTRSLTGNIGKHHFESSLERDLIYLMEWDTSHEMIHTQPVTIPYKLANGKDSRYTPDLLVHFGKGIPSLLCEVKYRADLAAEWELIKPKCKAAIAYAKSRGWRFKIFDEHQIRTPKLDNILFLRSFQQLKIHTTQLKLVKGFFSEAPDMTIQSLLQVISTQTQLGSPIDPSTLLWGLLAQKHVNFDIEIKLSKDTVLTYPSLACS